MLDSPVVEMLRDASNLLVSHSIHKNLSTSCGKSAPKPSIFLGRLLHLARYPLFVFLSLQIQGAEQAAGPKSPIWPHITTCKPIWYGHALSLLHGSAQPRQTTSSSSWQLWLLRFSH